MKTLFILFIFIASFLHCQEKKIVIFTCESGGGHMATASALRAILEKNYQTLIYTPQESLFPQMSRSYNYFLSSGSYNVLNSFYHVKDLLLPLFFLIGETKIYSHLHAIIEKEKPDLLISVVPYGNQVTLDLANKMDIPFLIVTSDNDIRHWVYGLKYKNKKNLHVTIGRDLPFNKTFLIENRLPLDHIHVAGLAVRPDFYEAKNEEKICQSFHFPQDKKKIILIFGGPGSSKIETFITKIDESQKGVHIIACTGKNEELRRNISEMVLHNENTITALPFTEKISDCMAVSDLCITKSGPGSIEEAFVLEMPLLIDGSHGFCIWEQVNAEIVTSFQVGSIIRDINDSKHLIHKYLNDKITLQKVASGYKKMPRNHFPKNISKLVHSLLYNDDN